MVLHRPHHLEIAPGLALHIRDWGAGRPVVFLHGWPLGHEMWEYQFNVLPQQGFRCVGISLRGFGGSSHPWGDYNYDVWAGDVHAVLARLDLSDATLVGFSMGGAIALRYAARHNVDRRVTRLALCGAAAPSFTERDGFSGGLPRSAVDEFLESCYRDRPKLIEDFGRIFYRNERSVSRKFAEWMHSLAMASSPLATAAGIIALRDTDLRDDMAHVDIPTRVLHAVNDKVCLFPLAEALAAGIRGAELIRFEQSGHAFFYEERDKFNAEIARFASDDAEE